MTRANVLHDLPGSQEPPGPPRRRRRRLWIALAAAVAAALITIGVLVVQRPSVPPPPTSGYAVDCLAVGAAVNLDGRPASRAQSIFHHVDEQIGPLTMRRSFDSSLPATFARSSAAGDAAAGLHSFVSWKPPRGDFRGTIAGKYDRRIAAWARSVPHTGVYATAFHEPENNMSAAEFVAFQRHVYPIVKKANPTIHWGPVYMAYWWDPAQPQHYVGSPAAWWPGKDYADFIGLDWYGVDPTPMTTSASFTNWYRFMAPKGLPLVLPEYGQYLRPLDRAPDPAKEQARARAIAQDATWIRSHPQFKAWLYWQGGNAEESWRLNDAASQRAWQAVADSGCRP